MTPIGSGRAGTPKSRHCRLTKEWYPYPMKDVAQRKRIMGWMLFGSAFFITVWTPHQAWVAIPAYIIAAGLFVSALTQIKRSRNGS